MNDPELPQEVRKVISVVRAEQQYGNDQITNAQEAEEFEALDELQMSYLKAKWDHYVDNKLSQF